MIIISSGSHLIGGDGDAKNGCVIVTNGGSFAAELSAPKGCEITAVCATVTGAEERVPGAGVGDPKNGWQTGESSTGVTNKTVGSAVISALGDIPKPKKSDQSSDG